MAVGIELTIRGLAVLTRRGQGAHGSLVLFICFACAHLCGGWKRVDFSRAESRKAATPGMRDLGQKVQRLLNGRSH